MKNGDLRGRKTASQNPSCRFSYKRDGADERGKGEGFTSLSRRLQDMLTALRTPSVWWTRRIYDSFSFVASMAHSKGPALSAHRSIDSLEGKGRVLDKATNEKVPCIYRYIYMYIFCAYMYVCMYVCIYTYTCSRTACFRQPQSALSFGSP